MPVNGYTIWSRGPIEVAASIALDLNCSGRWRLCIVESPVSTVSISEDVPQQPPNDPVLFIVTLDVMPKVIVRLRQRAGSTIDGQNLLVHRSFCDLIRREGRLHVRIIPILAHQVLWILTRSLSASCCLVLRWYLVHGNRGDSMSIPSFACRALCATHCPQTSPTSQRTRFWACWLLIVAAPLISISS